MSSFIDRAFAVADVLFEEAFGITVVLVRRKVESQPVTAQVVMRNYDVLTEGVPTVVHARDYLIARAAYDFGNGPTDPQAGDRIKEVIHGQDRCFELLPLGTRPAAEWADANGQNWLIHTKAAK